MSEETPDIAASEQTPPPFSGTYNGSHVATLFDLDLKQENLEEAKSGLAWVFVREAIVHGSKTTMWLIPRLRILTQFDRMR